MPNPADPSGPASSPAGGSLNAPASSEGFAVPSVREASFHLASQHRQMICDALKSGRFPLLLPDKDGKLDISAPVNAVNDTMYKGPNVLILKAHQAANGFPTAEYVSASQLEEASRKAGTLGTAVENAHPVTISVLGDKNPSGGGEPSVKFIKLFNKAEAAHPEALQRLVRERALEKELNFNSWQEKKAGEDPSFEIRKYYQPRRKENGPVMKISKAAPEKYLGQVFAAMSLGSKSCTVDSDTAGAFRRNLVEHLYEKDVGANGKEYTNPYKLYSLGHEASRNCKAIMQKMFRKPEQNAEQQPQKSRAREPLSLSI
jgi:hypothetical protein